MTIEQVSQLTEPLPRELIAPFDRLPDDFGTLKKELRDIQIAGTPELALLQARRGLECIIEDVYERRFREPTDKLDLVEMIEQLYKKEQLPPLIFHNAGYVRSLGNIGGHPKKSKSTARAETVSKEEVRSAIGLLVPIVEWYVKASQSGELDGPAVARDVKASPKLRLAIVPKGLDSFDAGDSPFFLKLLPGPFHADGLPESIHFWKERIEKEATFTVGVIYGRSGCGKSSLVKAGLLPRLAETVKRVYVEATADETEQDLLKGLRKQSPKLPEGLNLKEAIEALRRRPGPGSKEKPLLEGKQKVLIVLDQFEQWLHAQHKEEETELVRALRQCDGDRVQVLISVRDDFWESVSEFMEELNRPLKDGQNCKRVALFEQDHARQVLSAFGRAYGKLGEDLTPEQDSFLDEVIKNLSQDHRVICVRLALFAQMFQGKEWTLKALNAVGGTEGIGATFLEETFCSAAGDTQKYANHKDGAIAILKALLPEEGAEIKGRKRSAPELMVASGYQNHPKDFAKLLGYLDSDLRLISPTSRNPAGPGSGAGHDGHQGAAFAASYYQLTHDYLVPSLRKWLTRKLQETRRGRASLLLNARASMWNARHENRHMPTAREYLVIRALTNPREWNDVQRSMMHHARNVHLRRVAALLVTLPVLGLVGLQIWGEQHAKDMVGTLASAHISEVPKAIHQLSGYRRWADPLLREILTAEPEPGVTDEEAERRKLHAALALLPVDRGQLGYLRNRMLELKERDINSFPTLCALLSDHRGDLVEPLWQVLEDTSNLSLKRFRAAWALAEYTKQDEAATASRWAKSAEFVVEQMVRSIVENPGNLVTVLEILKPACRHLIDPLSAEFLNPEQPRHTLYATILADYGVAQPERLVSLLIAARDPDAFKKLFNSLFSAGDRTADLLEALLDRPSPGATIEVAAAQKANAAVALFKLGRPDRVWPLLRPAQDPRIRSYIIHRLSQMGADPLPIVDRLARVSPETDEGTRQALILALGEFRAQMKEGDFNRLLPEPKSRLVLDKLEADYRGAADPGVRGAAEWLLRTWGRGDSLTRIDESLKRSDRDRHGEPEGRRWFINAEGQTMVVVPRAGSFKIGSRREEPPDNNGKREPPRDVTINYPFAIGAHEVTLKEFRRFNPNHQYTADKLKPKGELDVNCPAIDVLWYNAAEYCNWLSHQDGIPEDQWCYQPNPDTKKYASGMRISDRFTSLTGYRLPTEVEWEYGCRAGTITSRYYGEADELLEKYVWFTGNSGKKLWPVGSKKPNVLGLFDTLGNALEWCQDAYHPESQLADAPDDSVVRDKPQIRVMRGEKAVSLKENIRAAHREIQKSPNDQDFICGFRVARTYRP